MGDEDTYAYYVYKNKCAAIPKVSIELETLWSRVGCFIIAHTSFNSKSWGHEKQHDNIALA